MALVRFDEEVLAPADLPLVARRLALSGSNVEIGRAVAKLAIARYGLRPEDLLSDARYVRARRDYFRRNYPVHLHRMRGVADAFGLRPDDDRFDFSILATSGSAWSAKLQAESAYTPSGDAATGSGLLDRWAALGDDAESRLELYIMEWRPLGNALASVAIHARDLLSGVIAGLNEAGIAVAAIGAGNGLDVDGAAGGGGCRVIGLHELQLMRLVLDTCSTLDEAQAALLAIRDFPMLGGARYLIADGDSRSFVYETAPDGTAQRILDGGGERQTIGTCGESGSPRWTWRCVIDQARRSLELSVRPAGAIESMAARNALGDGARNAATPNIHANFLGTGEACWLSRPIPRSRTAAPRSGTHQRPLRTQLR